jgi:hypothetical protein
MIASIKPGGGGLAGGVALSNVRYRMAGSPSGDLTGLRDPTLG